MLLELLGLEKIIRSVISERLSGRLWDGLAPLGHQFSILLVEAGILEAFFSLFGALAVPGHRDEIIEDEVDCVVVQLLALILLFLQLR